MAEWWEQDVIEPQQSNPSTEANWWDQDVALIENTGQSQASSALGAAGQGVLAVPSGVLGGVDALGSIVGLGSDTLRGASQAITEFGQQYSPVNPIYAQSFPVEAAGAVGQAAGQLATLPIGGLAGRLVGAASGAVRGAQVAGLGSGALMGADAGQETADRLGIENRAQRAAMILGQAGIELGTEMLGGFGSKEFTQGILGQLSGMPWKQGANGILRTALTEGGEEALAGTAQPFLERAVLLGEDAPSGVELTGIPLTSVDATLDVLKQAGLGAVAGGFMGGVNSVLNRPEPKNVLNFRLKAKARINELQNAPQLTEEEQSELTELQTEDQNAAQWLQDYGEQNIYEPLRQVINPTSDWRNQRESLIADTEDQAGKQNLRNQTNEEIEAATEILGRGGNPFSQEATTAALDEALTPPDPNTEAVIREASADPVVIQAKETANEVAAAGAPETARVLEEQANSKAVENVVAIEQEQLNILQQDEQQTTPAPERGIQPIDPAQEVGGQEIRDEAIRIPVSSGPRAGRIGSQQQVGAEDDQNFVRQSTAELPRETFTDGGQLNETSSPITESLGQPTEVLAEQDIQASEPNLGGQQAEIREGDGGSQEAPLGNDGSQASGSTIPTLNDQTTESPSSTQASSPVGQDAGSNLQAPEQAPAGQAQEVTQLTEAVDEGRPLEDDPSIIAFENALRNEIKDLSTTVWTPERIEEAKQWVRDGKQGEPPFGKGPVNRAVLASDREARAEWGKKEQELLRRFKRAESEDQPEIDDEVGKRAIERKLSNYTEIPAEELSLSTVFSDVSELSNGELGRSIRELQAELRSFRDANRDTLRRVRDAIEFNSTNQTAREARRDFEQQDPEALAIYDQWFDLVLDLSRRESELEGRGLNPEEVVPDNLKDYIPPKPRTSPNAPLRKGVAQNIQQAWEKISAQDEAFRGKKSTAKNYAILARDMSDGKVKATISPADGSINFTHENGGTISIENPQSKRPYIYAMGANSEGRNQGGGSLLYQIAFAWAHNNGKRIYPSNNLTEINAYVRRTSNMLSSALKYNTTSHLSPDKDQRVSGWKNGDHKANIARLAWREAQQVLKAIPEAANVRYDFQTGEFYEPTTQAGQQAANTQEQADPTSQQGINQGRRVLTDADLAQLATDSIEGGYANELGIGETTLKRAIITNTAAQDLQDVRQAPRNILYSQSPSPSGVTRSDVDQALSELNQTDIGQQLTKDVVIVDSLEDLREVTQNFPLPEAAYDLLSLAEGFFRPSTGESYVILDRVSQKNGESKVDSIKRVIFHERAFHGGFKWMWENDPSFARKAARIVDMIPKAELDALRDYPGVGNNKWAILEEWLARKLQQEDPNELAQRDPLFQRIWNAIKDLVARVLGKPATSEQVDREARELVGAILRNRRAFGNQAMAIGEDVVSPAEPSPSYSIPFSQRNADLNRQQVKEEAGFLPDAPDSMVQLHQVMGEPTEEAYVKQSIRPQADFVRERIWTGGLDDSNQPLVNEENTRAFWRENDKMTSDPEWAARLQDDFREMAQASQSPEIRNNRAEAIGSVAQLELMNYAQLMAASGTADSQEAVDAIRRGRFYNDTTLLRYANISGMARVLQARSAAARNGMMGFWSAFKQLDDAKEKAVSSKVGKGNVKKIQDAVNTPEDQDIDTSDIEEPTSQLTEDERLGIARDNEAQRIIDRIDESRTEWIGPPQNRSKIQALKREALSSELTDTTRPGHLTRDQFVRRYAQGFQSLGVSPAVSINLASRLYEENRRMKTDAFMRQMDSKVKNAGVNQLAKDLLSDPRNILGDPVLMKERMIEWLKGTGLTEEQATRWAKRHQAVFRDKLIQAREKALQRAIKGVKTITTPSVERIRQAIRAGALDSSEGVRNEIAAALGAKDLTATDLQRMASADLKMRDASPSQYAAELAKIRDILVSKVPDISNIQRTTSSWILSVLGGMGTVSLGATVPMFAGITRMGTQLGSTMVAGVTGRVPKRDIPSALAADLSDYVDSYKVYVDSLRAVYIGDESLAFHIDNLNTVSSLREDFKRQMERVKTGSFKERVIAAGKAAQSSTDIVRRIMNALDGGAIAVFQNLFYKQASRKFLTKAGMSSGEVSLLFQQAVDHGKSVSQHLFTSGQYDSPTSARIGNDASMDFLDDYMKNRFSSSSEPSQIRDFSNKEAAYEIGLNKREEIATWDVPQQISRMVQGASAEMARNNPILGRLILGFVSLPLNLMNRSLSYTPYGLLRLHWKNQDLKKGEDKLYAETMGSSLQQRQRYIEGVAGSVTLLILAALAYSGGGDDEDYTGLKITLNGPKDVAERESWLKLGFKPNSIMWVQNGKPVASLNYARGSFEALKFPLLSIGAIDDMRLNGELSNGNYLEHAFAWTKASLAGGLKSASFFGLENVKSAVALGDARSSDTSIISQAGWSISGFIPWSGLTKSIARPFVGQLDQTSALAAIQAQTPIWGAVSGMPARNFLGDQRGSQPVDLFSRASDRAYLWGMPLQLAIDPSAANGKAYELFVKKGVSPSMPSRSRLTSANGFVTDQQWERFVIARGNAIKQAVFSRYSELSALNRADFEDAISSITSKATKEAKKKLRLQ